MNFSQIKDVTFQNQDIISISDGNTVLWSKRYDVTWVINGHGIQPSEQYGHYYYGYGMTVLPSLSEEGWIFDGWYSDEQLMFPVTGITSEDKDNKTFYAKWTQM